MNVPRLFSLSLAFYVHSYLNFRLSRFRSRLPALVCVRSSPSFLFLYFSSHLSLSLSPISLSLSPCLLLDA